MIGNSNSSFFARMRRRFFNWRLNREIFYRVIPHAKRESDEGYPFDDVSDMVAQTESLDIQRLFAETERQVARLPDGYSKCFRYVMHRDISERLKMYTEVARRRAHPSPAHATVEATA